MAKASRVYFCNHCGYESGKWMGQCPGCREWNSFVEEPSPRGKKGGAPGRSGLGEPGGEGATPLARVEAYREARMDCGLGEMNRVLGGGIVPGSLILLGGDPGIGKSTILLQVCRLLSLQSKKILYVSGEESKAQIKMRADRLGAFGPDMWLFCETSLEAVEEQIHKSMPDLAVIDSIQTLYGEDISSAPGSVSQVRESTGRLMRLAKSLQIPICIVGHVTKEGTVAGPRLLEHMVDTVLYFEGERQAAYRVLRSVKNRFGATNEIGVFAMRREGLEEVLNPSAYMLQGRPQGQSGSVVSCSMEGSRPLLVELQALVCRSGFGIPRRQATGTDQNRVNLLMAVLEKKLGLRLADSDSYINVAGGIKVAEPAIDLGLALAIVSSFKNRPLDMGLMAFGEVGLAGEVRTVGRPAERVAEAAKLGFHTCVLPRSCMESLPKAPEGLALVGVDHLSQAVEALFG